MRHHRLSSILNALGLALTLLMIVQVQAQGERQNPRCFQYWVRLTISRASAGSNSHQDNHQSIDGDIGGQQCSSDSPCTGNSYVSINDTPGSGYTIIKNDQTTYSASGGSTIGTLPTGYSRGSGSSSGDQGDGGNGPVDSNGNPITSSALLSSIATAFRPSGTYRVQTVFTDSNGGVISTAVTSVVGSSPTSSTTAAPTTASSSSSARPSTSAAAGAGNSASGLLIPSISVGSVSKALGVGLVAILPALLL